MGNVAFGDNDEILTAAADWRVEKEGEKKEEGGGEREIREYWSQNNSWIKTT